MMRTNTKRKILGTYIPLAIIASMSVSWSLTSHAVIDPTRPDTVQNVQIKRIAAKKPRLSSILLASGRRLAVINDELVEVGSRQAGVRVLAIEKNLVLVRTDAGKRIELRLPQIKKNMRMQKTIVGNAGSQRLDLAKESIREVQ